MRRGTDRSGCGPTGEALRVALRWRVPDGGGRRRLWLAAGVGLVVAAGIVAGVLLPDLRAKSAAAARARVALAAMQAAYYRSKAVTYGNTSSGPSTRWQGPYAYLWGYSWALAAVEDVANLPGGRAELPLVRTLASGLQAFWDAGASPPAYAPTMSPGAGATKYFDDNAWVGLDLVGAWRLTHHPAYLRRAQAVLRYERTGWDRAGGGIYWNDKRLTRNAPSNAPVAELAARLYLATHQASDLRFAERIYAWEKKTLVLPSGFVADNVNAGGMLQGGSWTYNQGTFIGAGVLLYRATGRASYLADARKTARYVLHSMVQPDGAFVPQAQFNGVLADNLVLLAHAGGVPGLRAALRRNARLAWSHDRTATGLFGSNWAGPPPQPSSLLPELTQTGAVRTLAAAAAVTP